MLKCEWVLTKSIKLASNEDGRAYHENEPLSTRLMLRSPTRMKRWESSKRVINDLRRGTSFWNIHQGVINAYLGILMVWWAGVASWLVVVHMWGRWWGTARMASSSRMATTHPVLLSAWFFLNSLYPKVVSAAYFYQCYRERRHMWWGDCCIDFVSLEESALVK